MAEKSSFAHKAIGGMALGALAAGATVAVASVKMASDFQSAMELIHSQAGASQAEVNKMSGAVLALAGPTATAPAELAAGLYHLESAGLRGQKALDALKTAALGAKVGQANLEEVTNALNATIASGIPGSQNMNQAMGALNATVGAGDMRMSDLAEAFGTGFLATVKGFGVTLNDAGAALATFGDNNIRGADAATQLRQAVLFMAKPAAGAATALGKIGLKTTSLAKDMQTGGLNKAITDLHDHLQKAGYTGSKAGQILLDAFGHKAGTGISVLVDQYGRFESKIEEVRKGSEHFGDSVKATTHTFAFQWAAAKAAGEAFFIRLGTVLLPLATTALSGISKAFSTVSDVIVGVWGVISGSGAAENHLKGFSSGVQVTLIKLGGRIHEAMKVASEAFHRISGVVAPLLPVLERFGQAVARSVVEHLKTLVSVVRNDVWPSLQNLWKFLSPVLIDALKMVATVVVATVIVAFKALDPVLRGLGTALKATTGFLAQHKTAIQATAIVLGIMLAPLLASTVAMKAQAVATVVMTTVQKGLAVVTKAWAAAQWLLNAALDANPIGLAVIAVAALAAGFIYAYKHSETFRNIVKGAMHGVMVAIDFVKDHWKLFVTGFAFLVAGPFGVAIVLLITHFGTVKSVAKTAFGAVETAAKAVAGFFTGPFLHAIGTMVSMTITAFKYVADVWFITVGALVNGAAKAFGWVPGIGGKLKGAAKAFNTFHHDADRELSNLAADASAWGTSIGNHLEDGIVVGINGRRANTNAIAYSAGAAAANAIRHGAAVSSPSKITMYVGRMLAEGIIVGFTGARERLLHALSSTMQTALEHLHTYVLRVTNTMMARVSAARGVLAQAYSNRSQYAGQLAGQLTSGANLTNAIDSNTGTVGNLSSFLASQVAQMKTFAGALKGLSQRHLASGLLEQIAQAGPTQGLALAQSITPGQIGALNAEQAQLNRYASAAANTTAQSVYAAEIARDAKAVQAQLAEQRKANHLLELIARRVAGEKTAQQVAAELANLKRTTGRSLGLA